MTSIESPQPLRQGLPQLIATAGDRLRHGELGPLPVILGLAVIWAYFYATNPVFLSSRNLYFLFLQIAVVGTVAVGIVLVLLLGEIDLSVAAVAGVCAAVMAVLNVRHGWTAVVAIAAALALGALIGAVNGFFLAVVGIPSFVVTLAALLGFQGLMLKVLGTTGTQNVNDPTIRGLATTVLPNTVGWLIAAAVTAGFALTLVLGRVRRTRAGLPVGGIGGMVARIAVVAAVVAFAVYKLNDYRGVPLAGLILVGIVGVFVFVTTRTRFGRYIYAVGGNAEAARRAGIDVRGIRIAVFALASMLAATAGVIGTARYASVSYNAFAGSSLLLEAIAAAVIGGTSLFGGRGTVWSALLGALVIGSLSNGLDLTNATSATKLVVEGIILLAAVTVDAISRKSRLQAGRV